jgi:hypothetical protein
MKALDSGVACLKGDICNVNNAAADALARSAAADSTQPRRIISEISVESKLLALWSLNLVWIIYEDAVRTAQ